MIDTSLGPYKIERSLGAGGMGEVYLAQDTRLGRKVAVKVLPAEFASDPERLARFEQEARAAAALNHPHIAAVFDVGSAVPRDDGTDAEKPGESVTHYMVQEHLEGETLAEALESGRLPLKKALELAVEVAEALAAAHAAGIVHRDLKPANIFVTRERHAKVLDFGLAKLTEVTAVSAPDGATKSPTVLGTVAGQVMGTAGYMAPEQVEASDEIDRRADIFAFGCVLYETVAGARAFAGTSVLDTLHRIAHRQPRPLAEIDEELPAEIQRILSKCLAKEPSARYQHADDLIVDLKGLATQVETGTAVSIGATSTLGAAVASDGEAGQVAAAASPRGLSWKLAIPVLALVGALAALAGWALQPAASEAPVRRFVVPYPPETTFESTATLGVAISPDGEWVVFNADRQLWLRAIGDLVAEPIRGTEGGRNPFFSPDGRQLGFWGGDGQMKRVAVTGGAPVSLGAAPDRPTGASWGADGHIYFGQVDRGILRVSENGGEPEVVAAPEAGETLGGPELLPGADWLLYAVTQGTWGDATIVAQSLADGERKVLVQGGTNPRYSGTGHLVYGLDGNLLAIPFDAATASVSGGPVAIVEGVTLAGFSGMVQYGFSRTGDLVYMPGSADGSRFDLVMIDRAGNVERLPFEPADFQILSLSPDGRRIAVMVNAEGGSDIWLYEIDGGRSIRLTADASSESPAWSPDGEYVYYRSVAESPAGIWRVRVDRSAPPERITSPDVAQNDPDVSPDGTTVAVRQGAGPSADIALVPTDGGEPARVVVSSGADDLLPDFSPDGRFLAYMSAESGEFRIYVVEIETGRQWPVSPGIGFVPVWSAEGTELFYWGGGSIDVADVATEPQFRVLGTRTLVQGVGARGFTNFEPTSDAERFLFVRPTDGPDTGGGDTLGPRLHVVLGWFGELAQRVPTGDR